MSTYADQLQSAKLAALEALGDLLATTEDPIEKRRIATTILRIPTPRATDRCSGGERSVRPTPDAGTNENSPSPQPTTQDSGPRTQDSSSSPHPTSAIPHPTLPPLSSLDARLDALHTELDHHLANLLNSIPETTPPSSAPP